MGDVRLMLGWIVRRSTALMAAWVCCAAMATSAAWAQPAGLHPDRYAGIVVEARTGQVLFAAQADEPRHPASLTKMMTLYLLFEAMREGRLTADTPIRFSSDAASQPPSKLGIPAGGAIAAETAVLALVTRSANDVAVAVAEHLAGSEDRFARVMTMRARQLGMTRTTFRNASGLPDWEQVTTARDMALLGRRLIADFPTQYRYFNTTHFAHGRRLIRNHNGMLLDYDGADGIKTGFINASGFNIVTSAQRDNVRLVTAVFGGTSWANRNRHAAELLDDGFERMGVRPRPTLVAAAPRVVAGREAEAPRPTAANRPRPTLVSAGQPPSSAARRAPGATVRPGQPQPLVRVSQPAATTRAAPQPPSRQPRRAAPATPRPPAQAAQPVRPGSGPGSGSAEASQRAGRG
jgi:D-alanyl-D-alanine carboxypeptidase